ncbi:nitroreductase/quinone reductase family protein [Nocardia jiangsuensis]|uniref:Nitroreductase/quinone reductase family protein n=1 Tax=Nocardia jiangsuensis TaxID=1691563 RepID=A0ABV8E1U5_9NOCA
MASVFVRLLQAHQWVYERSDGRLGHRVLLGNPTLLLRTVGRKTGEPRVAALTYGRDGDDFLVTASNGGADRAPGWLANVQARPECAIQVGREKIEVTAVPTYPGDPDYLRRWTIVDGVNQGRYTDYQKLTARPLAVVVLTPARGKRA